LVVIREILIDAPQITYELGSDGSNFDAIQKNIVRFMSGAAGAGGDSAQTAAGKEEAGKEDAGGKKLMIATFVIQGGKIDVSASGLAGSNLTVALPRIHINNIGRNKGGASPGAVAQIVFAEITGKVKGAVLPLGIGGALGAVEKRVKGLTEAVGKGAEGASPRRSRKASRAPARPSARGSRASAAHSRGCSANRPRARPPIERSRTRKS